MSEASKEVSALLRQLAQVVEVRESVSVLLAQQSVDIPGDADIKVEYDREHKATQLLISVTWGLTPSSPVLIRTHNDQVVDGVGNLYNVLVYGRERAGGTWEGWLEFVPLTRGLSTRRTDRETTQPDRRALDYWATGLETLYLGGAFERAL